MATRIHTAALPGGMGRFSRGWLLVTSLLLVLVAAGAFAYALQLIEGDIVTGMRDVGTMGGAPWGLYVTFDIYFGGVGFAALSLAALIRLFDLRPLRPLFRIALLLGAISAILAGLAIIADLGQPFRGLVNIFRYGRPGSPFFGTATLAFTGLLFASLVYLYLEGRKDAALLAGRQTPLRWFYRAWAAGYRGTPEEQLRHQRASFWLALVILPLLVIAHSTLGFVFGLQSGRAGWYSALQAPAFVVLAAASGVGVLIVAAGVLRALLGEGERLNVTLFRWLSNLLTAAILVYLYFLGAELLTSGYEGRGYETQVTEALLMGEYASLFWLSGALLVAGFGIGASQTLTRRYHLPSIVLAGILVNLAAIGKRYLIVVPSLTHGSLLPYPTGSYSPSWVEYAFILGLFAFGTLLFVLFMKVFPVMEVRETD